MRARVRARFGARAKGLEGRAKKGERLCEAVGLSPREPQAANPESHTSRTHTRTLSFHLGRERAISEEVGDGGNASV